MLSQSLRGFTLITAVAAILFLPASLRAQADKDAEIERLKKDSAILEMQIKATKDRLLKEIESLNKTIKEREAAIVRLEADVKRYRIDAVQFEALAKTRQIQNEILLEQMRAVTLELARVKKGLDPAPPVRDPNGPNPPKAKLNGKIEKVEGDLVQISLGTDHGLNKGNTLDVYRITPNAKYLGMVRITEAKTNQSVGRIVPPANPAFRLEVKVGDLVTSSLSTNPEKHKDEPPKDPKKPPKN